MSLYTPPLRLNPCRVCAARARCAAGVAACDRALTPRRVREQVPSWSEFLTRDDFLGVTSRGQSSRFFLVTTRFV